MRLSRLLTRLGLGLLAGVALLFLAGVVLPREHRARSCITLDQPAESLWVVMRDIGGTPAWWPELESATRNDSAGVERWTEVASGFTMVLRVEEVAPGEHFDTVIEAPPGAVFGGRWSYRIGERTGAGHAVCLTEEGWVANPLFRAISALTGHHGTLDSYLRALARRFGTTYVPEHLD